mmetsp:Transcript_48878/g.140483  ORF Transcript_48878/g.140483 Transcript_48878/m.140483 type:complete len:308 (-) Transcript_48878:347-1270(-)
MIALILYPIPRMLAHLEEFSFGSSWLWNIIVFPASSFRQTHEDTLDTSTSLQSKDCSSVVDQVELNITSTSHKLPFLLLLGEFIILVLLNDRPVSLDNRVQTFLAEFENGIRVTVVLVIEENSSESSSFITVLNDEVSVSPSLEFLVVFRVMLVADFLVSSVEVLHVVLIDVTGSDIGTASEPPNATVGLEVSVVEVHGRAERVLGVHHTAQSTGKERDSFTRSHSLASVNSTFGGGLKGFLRHGSVDNAQVDSCLFENLSSRKNSRHTTTAICSSPAIFFEFAFSVNFLNGFGDGNLSISAHFLEF